MEYQLLVRDLISQNQTITLCDEIVQAYQEDSNTQIRLDFTGCDFIYADYAILFLCTIKYLERLGFKVGGNIILNRDSGTAKYLAKMNFFENLKVEFPFEVQKTDDGTAVRMQKYNRENQLEVLQSILKVLRNNSSMHENVYTGLDYCLNEILDNVLNHSEENEGWVVAQYSEELNSIRLIVADFGIGIHKSLNIRHNFSESEALFKCIEEGITNGKGQGHGLYATSSFVKLNKGWLSVCSGTKKLNVTEKQTIVKDVAGWNGTYVYLRINTNIDVDYTEFTSKNYDYKKQIFEDLFD